MSKIREQCPWFDESIKALSREIMDTSHKTPCHPTDVALHLISWRFIEHVASGSDTEWTPIAQSLLDWREAENTR